MKSLIAFTCAALLQSTFVFADAPQGAATAEVLRTYPAPEARQGVAVDAEYVYAVSNWTIAKYDKRSGQRVALWEGDKAQFPHINSCTVIEVDTAQLVCANSNFPSVPHWSSVEFFDPVTLRHIGSVSLGPGRGSLTWVERHEGAWYAAFANYDGKGGEPPRDHRHTVLIRFDDEWRQTQSWSFPATVLERFAPMSSSGGGWGPNGHLYVTGHDHPELYILRLPKAGAVLEHVGTIAVPIEGQAIDWDETAPGEMYGITRKGRQILRMRIPNLRTNTGCRKPFCPSVVGRTTQPLRPLPAFVSMVVAGPSVSMLETGRTTPPGSVPPLPSSTMFATV